jgi:hypothetical protein
MQAGQRRIEDNINHPATGGHWEGVHYADMYAARYVTYINIKTKGMYTFETISDDGSKLYLNGELVVNNDGLHGMRSVKKQVQLTPGYFEMRVTFFEHGGGAGLQVYYQGPNIDRMIIPPNVLYIKPPADVKKGGFDYSNGLMVEVYDGFATSKDPPSISWIEKRKPIEKLFFGQMPNHWNGWIKNRNNWAAKWETHIVVSKGGRYHFKFEGDGAAQVYLNGHKFIYLRNGYWWDLTRVYLNPGYYKLTIIQGNSHNNIRSGFHWHGPETGDTWRPICQLDECRVKKPENEKQGAVEGFHIKMYYRWPYNRLPYKNEMKKFEDD